MASGDLDEAVAPPLELSEDVFAVRVDSVPFGVDLVTGANRSSSGASSNSNGSLSSSVDLWSLDRKTRKTPIYFESLS